MKLELKGAVCVITGRMKSMTKAVASQRLMEAGARMATSVSGKTTFVVVAEQWTNDHTKAKAMGLPILSEQELEALLAGEAVEVDEVGEAGDRSVDELLGEVRSVMQGAPCSQMWHALVAMLDACRAEDVHVLTEYIDGYIARWTTESMQGQQATTLDTSPFDDESMTRRWAWRHYDSLVGELRVAPEHWIGELQQGVRSPKFAIVRAIDLRDSGVSSKVVVGLLDHPDLTSLEALKLSMYLKMSGALIKRICQDERLRDLGPGQIARKQQDVFVTHGQRSMGLQQLDMRCYTCEYSGEKCEFIKASYFDDVTTLVIRDGRDSLMEIFEIAQESGALGSVRRLIYSLSYGNVDLLWRRVLKAPWLVANLRELDLGHVSYHPSHDKGSWKQFLDLAYEGHLEVLDLSGLRERDNEEDTRKVKKMLAQYLPKSRLLERVDTLVLGALKSPRIEDLLAKRHPQLQLV